MRKVIYSLLSLFVLSSCSKDIEQDFSPADGLISFSTYTGSSTRALGESVFEAGDAVTVNAFAHTGPLALQPFVANTIKDRTLTNLGTSWKYEPVANWPAGQLVSFFGIYPEATAYDIAVGTGLITIPGFAVGTDAATQVDLMWSGTPDADNTAGTGAKLAFRHALSNISFNTSLVVADAAIANPVVTIKSVVVAAAVADATYTVAQDLVAAGVWTAGTTTADYSPLAADVPQDVTGTSTLIGTDMLLLPQTSTDKVITVTYDVVYAEDAAGQPAYTVADQVFTFSPGVDWVQNTKYLYNLTFDLHAIEFSVTETVVEWETETSPEVIFDIVDFRKNSKGVSNSYILNRDALGGQTKQFLIPISERINDFYTNYEADAAKTVAFAASKELSAEILWTDFVNTDTTKNLQVAMIQNPAEDILMGFVANVDANVTGNAVVVIKKAGVVLWSWHLWMTDYNPDLTVAPVLDTYTYTIEGMNGNVHRLADGAGGDAVNGLTAPWANAYATKFMMDRNVGSVDAAFAADYGAGSLYYQFGRKDPFPGNANGVAVVFAADGTIANHAINPLTFYTASVITGYDGLNIRWNDKLKTDGSKSIFDPSPLGWKLPENGTFSDFALVGENKYNTGISEWDAAAFGLKYRTDVFFPASGYRNNSSGALTASGTSGGYWVASPNSATHGYYLFFNSTAAYASGDGTRATGVPVRPVQE